MKVYKVITDDQHFNHLRDISFDIQKLGSVFQNEGTEITQQDLKNFNNRYQEVITQLETWHAVSLSRFKEK